MKNGAVIWIAGLVGSGKSTLALALEQKLKTQFSNVILLDGDFLREIYNDFDYTKEGRLRIALQSSKLVEKLALDGNIVIFAVATMQTALFKHNRKNIKNYYEILISCSLDELIRRDKKGLYSKAIKGEICNVWGVDLEPEFPKADFVLDNSKLDCLEEKAELLFCKVLDFLDSSFKLALDSSFKLLNTQEHLTNTYPLIKELRPYLSKQDFISQVYYLIKYSNYKLLGFFENGKLISICGVMPFCVLYRKKCLLICDFIVDGEYRNKGYGTKILKELESLAKNQGYLEIALESGNARVDAHRFYTDKIGFTQVGLSFKKQL